MSAAADLSSLLATSERIVVFTGAGISTESGIPDFRSPGGVWSRMSPIYFQDFVASRDMRREAWRRVFNKVGGWTGAEPNAGHYAVARLIGSGKASSVITQNVDNLHQSAGAPDDRVIEIHGNASYAKCLQCEKRFELEPLRPRWEADEDITCDVCGGLIKTATISFGQAMPEAAMARAVAEARACDLFLVLGSSLVVYPAASLPLIAKDAGARLVIVNREPTEQDGVADLVLNTEIGALLTAALAPLNSVQ
ncbi:MAG: NAD-dependent deacetylase [Rhodobiaceae bacterium]|nr:Sir2 family NAD-dependent protein deacetylase [Rhodobiaceae bacterium]MCC0056599.1 NAD-dependent deacetylase [Rhodobiaceae bacterium]